MSKQGIANDPSAWLAKASNVSWADSLPRDLDILVLSLGCTLTNDNASLSTSSLSSLMAGIEQYKNWKAMGKRVSLVCVGAGYHQDMPHYEWDLMMERALLEGIPQEDLFGEPHSFNTPMNAVCIAVAIKERRIGAVVLTSDPLHSERAHETFKGVFKTMGITVRIIPVGGEMPKYGNSSKWFLRKAVTWRIWNKIGRAVLPRQLKKLKSALNG